MQKNSLPLPIDHFQETIERTIDQNQVVIITAETGAGKSTRVPYWFWRKGKKIHVTQPRRIATRSLSYYLAKLTDTPWGREIGYQTGFDRKFSENTRLLYLTDGVQMIKEIKNQHDYDILILDEIHEWNLNQEVLIGMVKKKLENGFYKKEKIKVVVMSATLETEKLARFLNHSPIISVTGRGFPVTMHHHNPVFLLADTAQMVEQEKNSLVFQPGKNEITEFIRNLNEMLRAEKLKAEILPLHSELSIKDQAKVFENYPLPKVVVATDIAQTSLTIDDIDTVIDTGIKKELQVVKSIEGLYPVNISTSECLQRAGRAGRVKNGQYILCAEAGIKERPPYPEPEIQRLNLDSVILRLIKWKLSPTEFLFFHPPGKNLIYRALKRLKIFGAIYDNNKITSDGKKMAEFPVSIRSSRLLLESQKGNKKVVGCALKIIAIIETKGIVNKEYLGEKYYQSPYKSDLLNQLYLWETASDNRRVISTKKMALAQDIYKELKKRISANKVSLPLNDKEEKILYRAILSFFIDRVFLKNHDIYQKDNQQRQLDRTSILYESKPQMISGTAFDLVTVKENNKTGEKEKKIIPLVTFASEISVKLLETLRPYSFWQEHDITIENSLIQVLDKIYFGGELLVTVNNPPDWENKKLKDRIVIEVIKWYKNNKHRYGLDKNIEKLRTFFPIIQNTIGRKLLSFDQYKESYLLKELTTYLNTDNLDFFFKFHRHFHQITLKDILPNEFIEDLKRVKWPAAIDINQNSVPVSYIKNKPFLNISQSIFEKMTPEHLVLPTGESGGIILGNRKFVHWDYAVYYYNRLKKLETFEKKWKNYQKPVALHDIIDLNFPQNFIGGSGKDNISFEFYLAPHLEEENVYLIHFFEKEKACAYFQSIESEWNQLKIRFKQKKIETIFKKKGWKIK